MLKLKNWRFNFAILFKYYSTHQFNDLGYIFGLNKQSFKEI